MRNPLLVIFCFLCLLCVTVRPSRADNCLSASCHTTIAGLKNQHAPVKDGECQGCHVRRAQEHPIKGGKSFAPAAKGAALCNNCHDAKGKQKVVHTPVKDGDCVLCHQPHGAEGRFLLTVGDDQTELCVGCHDAGMFKQKFMHGPAAVGSCTECHDPHESNAKGLLKAPVRDLCLKCHADFAREIKAAPMVHPPVKDGPCTACHDAHGTPYPPVLKKKMPDLCVGCHAAIGKKAAGAKVPHKPLLEPASCSSCHSSHYAKAKGLLPFDEMTTCLKCHDREYPGTPGLRNIKREIAGRKFLHGPIAKGQCKACHDPHGSDYYRLLRGNYPTDLYVPYKDGAYGACLGCHEKNLLRYADTTLYTSFRNGKRNLHFVHVNSVKGRSCRMCHEPHGADEQKLIRKEGIKFGDWKIPINFQKTDNGGSCAPGCHKAFKYDREKAVKYH